jgi:hypothetical protein
MMRRLPGLKPRPLAIMHCSTFVGDGAQAIHDLAAVMKEALDT